MDDMNMDNIIGEIGKIKNRLGQIQKELDSTEVTGTDDNDLVKTVVNGKGKILDFKFTSGTLDKEIKEALIRATNDAIKKARKLEGEMRQNIVGDIDMPDMPGLFD